MCPKNMGLVERKKCKVRRFHALIRTFPDQSWKKIWICSFSSQIHPSLCHLSAHLEAPRIIVSGFFSNPLFSPAPSSCTLLKSSSNHKRHRGSIQQPAIWRSGPRSARRASWSGRCSPGWTGLVAREPKAPAAALMNVALIHSNLNSP